MKQYWFGGLVVALAFVLGAGAMWAYQESTRPQALGQAGTQEFGQYVQRRFFQSVPGPVQGD